MCCLHKNKEHQNTLALKNLRPNTNIQSSIRGIFTPRQLVFSICSFIFICWCFSFPTLLSAQKNPQPYFRNYGTEHGLPSPEVYFAMEDSKGYMWFGTDNGAVRFDGYDFETFDAQDGLMSNVVFDIYEDKKGRMWFGTMTGEVYIMEGDTILPYQYNHLVKGFEGQFTGAGLLRLDEDEKAYIALNNYGLITIDATGKVDTVCSDWVASTLILNYADFDKTIVSSSHRKDFDNYIERRDNWFFFKRKTWFTQLRLFQKKNE